MAQLLTVRLTRGDAQPWGFRLQGGKDFGTPLLIQKVNSGSLADQVGLIAGDAVIKINGIEVFDLRHKDAQDVVVKAGNNVEIAVQRGGSTWKPNVTPTGNLPTPNQYGGLNHVTKTSLAHKTPDGRPISAIGTGYNNAARPFTSPTGAPVKSIVNKQYNTPVGIYSDETIAETLSAQAEVLAGGVLGVNFKKNEKMYNSANSEVYKMLQEQANEPEEPELENPNNPYYFTASHAIGGHSRSVTPSVHSNQLVNYQATAEVKQQQQHHMEATSSMSQLNYQAQTIQESHQSQTIQESHQSQATSQSLMAAYESESGVFVRIKDKNLHAECFKCHTCGTSLKNRGYYNVNNNLYCDIHARQAALQKPPQGTQGYSPVPIKPDSKIGANIIQAALQNKSASNQYNGTSQNNNNSYIVTPSHSRTNSSDSSRSLSNKNSLINSNRTTPSQSGKSSPILNGIKSEIIINLTDRLEDNSKYNPDDVGIDESDYRKYNLCFQTLNGGTIRSVKPPGKGYDTNYKINNPYAAPKPYNYSQPPQAGPKSPSSYPPSAPSWTQPQGHQVNQGKQFNNSYGPSYQELCCAQEICNVMSKTLNVQTADSNHDTISSLNWPPTTKSSIVNDSGRYTPTASPLYIQPPETVHYEARVHTQTSTSKQQQKIQKHEQHTNTNNLLKSNIDLESSSESYTSTTISSDEQQKIYQTSLTHANQMNNYSDVDLSENDLSALQHYKMSLCSSEVNDIVLGRRSVQECAESVSDSINTQLLIDAVKESSPRPPSPIPKPYKRVEFANEKPMPKEQQVMTEGSQTNDGSLQQNNDDIETELIDLRSEELDDDALVEKYHIPETKAISPTNIPNPIPQKYQSEMLKALKAESDKSWRPVSTPTIEIDDYENVEMKNCEMQQSSVTQMVSVQSEERSVHEEMCIKKEAKSKEQVTSVIEVAKEPQKIEQPLEAPKAGFMTSLLTTAPSQPMEFVPKPTNEPVPLPEVTVPYLPPPISMTPIIHDDDWGRSKTPLLSALTVAPNDPYSPFGKKVSSQLDDLPRFNPNEKSSLAGALTVAPDRSYTPFTPGPEQIYTCCVSEPVYTETNPVEQESTISMSETNEKSSAFANVNGFSSSSTFKPRMEALNWFNSTPLPYCAHKSDAIWSNDVATCKSTEIASSTMCSENINVESHVEQSCSKPIQRQPPHEHPTTLSYQKKPYYSGLHKPDTIPVYQKDLMKLPSQVPVRPPESPQLRENVPIAFLDTPEFASNLHKPIAISASSQSSQTSTTSQIETQSYVENKSVSFAENRTGTITMAFQSLDQYDDQQHQKSFIPTNRPVTPSLINKPAPTIPYYQQNLCPIECQPTESHVFDPHSRSPSPYPERAKSPAPGPPPNPLRAVCPRIKEKPATQMNKKLETEIKTQVAEKADQKTYSLVGFKNVPAQQQSLSVTKAQSAIKPITTYTAATSQFADVKDSSNYNIEKHASAAKFTEIPKTVQETRIGDMNIQTTVQGSAMAQQHKSEKQSSETTNVGNKQIQRRTRVVEEFERSRSEKQMEIVKTQGDMSRRVTFDKNACGGAAAAAVANSSVICKTEGFVAKQARRLSQDTNDLKKFPITIDLTRPMTNFPSISSSPKVRQEENLPRLGSFCLPETPCSITQLGSNSNKAQSVASLQYNEKHADQMNTLTQQHKQEHQQKSIASSTATTTTAAYTNANQQQLSSYKKFETAPTTAKNVNNTKYPQSITKSSIPPTPMLSKIQAPSSIMSQKLTQQKITPNAVVSDSSPASAGLNSTKGGVFGATTAPKRGRGTLNKAVGPGARVPLCGCCNTQIRGPFITALGRIWCPDHFVCSTGNCRRQLQDIGFVEEKNQLYCEFCFEKYLAPACSKCNSKIKGDCLNAIGKHYHPECFTCTYCGKLFGNSAFFLEEGDAYCEADWNELFTTKCFACGFPVEAGDRWVEALNNNYHSQCFNCSMCKKNLEGQSFVAKGGRPFCKNHAR